MANILVVGGFLTTALLYREVLHRPPEKYGLYDPRHLWYRAFWEAFS